MPQRHIILRAMPAARGAGAPGVTRGPAGRGRAAGTPVSLRLDVDEIDRRRVGGVARERDVVAVAPAMPMRLMKPLKTSKKAAKPGKVEWGVRAVGADSSPFSGTGVVVAVLDTGIDAKHPAFKGLPLTRKNFTKDAQDDSDGHGTHCAGTIFGRDVAGTRIGVAPGVTRALIGKVIAEDGAESDQVARAIQWAVNEGAHVISMSLGLDFPGFQKELVEDEGMPPELATSQALEGFRLNLLLFEKLTASVKAMSDFTGNPTIIVAAAGNESQTDVDPDFKIAVSPPAVSDGIVSVAALGESASGFVVAPFSNTGALIAGPGVDIRSARPASQGGGLILSSGTSMAAPHVAGVAALWAEKLRGEGSLSAALLAGRLLASGSLKKIKKGFDPIDVGSGMVSAPQE